MTKLKQAAYTLFKNIIVLNNCTNLRPRPWLIIIFVAITELTILS